MKTIQAYINRHPLPSYYFLTFAISWGGILMVIDFGAIPGEPQKVEALWPIAILALFAGPSVASVLLTSLLHGRTGLRELLSRLLRWRVAARWYVVALLAAPLISLSTLLPLSLVSPQFLPGIITTNDKASLLLLGIISGLVGGGFLEELGWTGFAVPRLRLRYGVWPTALIVGVLWGAWHVLVIFWMAGNTIGSLPLGSFLAVRGLDLLLGGLVAFRVLLVWVYDRTGSLLVTMLMHASLSASMHILGPAAVSGGVPFLIYLLAGSAATWLVVAAVALARRAPSWRRPLASRRMQQKGMA